MAYEILKLPQAERDIEECFVFIAENNLDKGVYFLVAVEDSIEQFAKFPFLGNTRNFQNVQFQDVRMWRVKGFENYLIFYSVKDETIEVIRVLHSSRNIDDLFN